jgi:hypothetical protein
MTLFFVDAFYSHPQRGYAANAGSMTGNNRPPRIGAARGMRLLSHLRRLNASSGETAI